MDLVRLSLQELAGSETATTQHAALKDRMARVLNCSKRHLHNAFADEEDTLGQFILRRRLQACLRDLKNPEHRQRTITNIAFSWGFSNGAHFSRVFREHTGLSPSDFRQVALTEGKGRTPVPGHALRRIDVSVAPVRG